MANTSVVAPLSIYGLNANAYGTDQGKIMGFPTAAILVRPVDTATSFNGVTMNSIIQLLPTPNLHVSNQPQYYSPKTVSEVVTICNTTS